MEHTHNSTPPQALPGLWREAGGLAGVVRLDVPATSPGMVMVAKQGEPWREQSELRWQVWPDLLVPDAA
ncbi:hypothetical protein CE206_29635 (plasmid) [Achromobacter xylosoxidans]|uniref:hypothetical protein n=1 Tax=Alcaligenes xylosoxydans xylosoxydans TaxID=85698 RepID=UPI000DD0FCBE|nr:hypothetical protein [Achromobacter xylosoxidans]AXA80723.1 hypothetical protein CE206_29635 [Achromobacter xylosoxidans]